jgi:hypothetical protein
MHADGGIYIKEPPGTGIAETGSFNPYIGNRGTERLEDLYAVFAHSVTGVNTGLMSMIGIWTFKKVPVDLDMVYFIFCCNIKQTFIACSEILRTS